MATQAEFHSILVQYLDANGASEIFTEVGITNRIVSHWVEGQTYPGLHLRAYFVKRMRRRMRISGISEDAFRTRLCALITQTERAGIVRMSQLAERLRTLIA